METKKPHIIHYVIPKLAANIWFLGFMIPSGILMVTIYVLLIKFIFRVDASKIANFKQEGGVPKITKDQSN